MQKIDKLIINSSLLSGTDLIFNNLVSQDYNIKFSGRPVSAAGKNLSLLAQDAQALGTNLSGGSVVISGGISTGSGSSSILLKTAKGGSSGTGDNTPTTKLTITGTGVFPVFLSAATNPTTSDIPSGTSTVFKNTATGDLQVWVNDSGTIKILTPPVTSGSNDYWLSAKITYSAVGDGVANDSTALTSAFSVSNTIVYLPSGTYKLNSTITLTGVSNLKIIGTKNTKITSSTLKTLLSFINCNNIEIIDVAFESTVSDSGSTADTTNGLLKFYGGNDLRIIANKFTAPTAITHGVKIVIDDSHTVSNIKINQSKFDTIGQRGIEIGTSSYTNKNLSNVDIDDNFFNNTGTKVPSVGHAISIKAYSTNINISENNIIDCGNAAIEADGVYILSIENNILTAINKAFSPFSIRNTSSGKTTTGLSLSDNVVSVRGGEDNTTWIENVNEFTISGNSFKAGVITLKGSNGMFNNNNILSDDDRVLYLEASSSNNFITLNVLDNSTNISSLEPIITGGAGVNNNIFTNNLIRTASGNNPYYFGTGATNNIYQNTWQ